MPIASFDFPDPHIRLQNENFVQITHSNDTGRIGQYSRSAGDGYTDETLIKFDLSSLGGATITAVELQIVATSQGTNTSSTTSNLYEQDKTNPTSWSDPPEFDDFAQTTWGTTLSSVTVQNTGTYTYPTSPSFVAYVQSWVDNPADNWGLIIDANFGTTLGWLGLDYDQTILRVTYTLPSTNKEIFNTAGGTTFQVPAGVTSITAKLWAGGAGGGAGGTSGVGGDGGGGNAARRGGQIGFGISVDKTSVAYSEFGVLFPVTAFLIIGGNGYFRFCYHQIYPFGSGVVGGQVSGDKCKQQRMFTGIK